jgi:peptide/nickel transport system ATP-binding protein
MIFQDPRSSLDPRMRVADIVTEPLRSPVLRGHLGMDAGERLAQVLTQVGLPIESARRYPHEFSGGQRQRIAIARAIIAKPDVLIADEAVSSLDVSVRAHVLNLLAALIAEYGLTLIFVSHDLSVVRHVCDRVVVMRRGEVVEAGPVEQVYADPQHPYTRELVASVPRIRRRGTTGRRSPTRDP